MATGQQDFTIEQLPATFGAIVNEIRLPTLDDATFQRLYAAWLDHGLLIFPGQHLSKDEQVAFARRFGEIEVEFGELTNLLPDGRVRPFEVGEEDAMVRALKGNMGWHQDSSFMPVQAKGAIFSAITIPGEGGETGFADMEAAYAALPEAEQQALAERTARHSLVRSQGKLGYGRGDEPMHAYGFDVGDAPRRPLVKTHPETGRKSLAIGRHAYAVDGMDEAESESFIDALIETACQGSRIWAHEWQVGDVVVWDNRRLLHRSMPWDMNEPRVMWHTRIAGDPISELGLAEATA